jgi:hypothetical protein
MAALIEIPRVRQIPGELRRRWFRSDDFDLIVWYDDRDAPAAFQLCYDKAGSEQALTWNPEMGFLHMSVDDGEAQAGGYKATPLLLVADGRFDANRVSDWFLEAIAGLPPEIVEFVSTKLRQHPNYIHRP